MIGKNIKLIRQQQKITQEQLAEIIGTDQKYISKIESGKARPRITVYLKIANTFHVSIDQFLIDVIDIQADLYETSVVHQFFSNQAEQKLTQRLLETIFQYLQEKG